MHRSCLGRMYHFFPSSKPSIKQSNYYRRGPLQNAKDSTGGNLHPREEDGQQASIRSERTAGAMGNVRQGKDDGAGEGEGCSDDEAGANAVGIWLWRW